MAILSTQSNVIAMRRDKTKWFLRRFLILERQSWATLLTNAYGNYDIT